MRPSRRRTSPAPPDGTTELGIDIVRVARIRAALERFGQRFVTRVCSPSEAAYVRGRPETLAGRWAAKEAVSKVLGLGVRGIGWRDIEIERLPTGQPAVVLHGRAAERAAQLGMGRIALSISHEDEFAVAIAYGVRTAAGRYRVPAGHRRADRRPRARPARASRARPGHRGRAARGGDASGASARRSRAEERVDERHGRHAHPRGADRRDGIAAALLPSGRSAATRARSASCSSSPVRSTTRARRSSSAEPPAAPAPGS